MRALILLFSLVVGVAALPTEAAQRGRGQAARSGLALTVTGVDGRVLPGVAVELTGTATEKGETDAGGQVSFPRLAAGTYRVRFSGDAVTAFEREVILRAGQIARLDIKLTPAPPPRVVEAPAPPPPAPPPPPPVGPAGDPHVLSMVDLIERELVDNRVPRKDTLVACSGNTRSMLVQLNEPQARRVYEGAEALYYVIAGEGTMTVDGKDVDLEAGAYAALPRGAAHAIAGKAAVRW